MGHNGTIGLISMEVESVMDVRKFSVPEILYGRGSLKYAAMCAKRLGGERIFLVSDPGLEKVGWVEQIFKILDEEKLAWTYFNEVTANPRDYQVEKGAALYDHEGCDVVMALGGGSPMDAAKGIAIVASNGGSIKDYEGANQIQRPLPPMVFMPSTAGSGADISQFAIITDTQRHVKMSIISRTLVPNISITDPILLTTKPAELIIASAIDALAHAIEAYVSRIAYAFTEIQSLKAIDLIIKNLPKAIEDRALEALEMLSTAGAFAAMAFSNASLGLDHALAHSLGGKLDLAHGLVHPVLLPNVMRYNMPVCQSKMADIGEIVLGRRLGDEEQTALTAIKKLESFFRDLNITTALRDIVMDAVVLPPICRMATQDACLVTNPREATWEAMLEICEASW
jgi:alcohol dehydrogenase